MADSKLQFQVIQTEQVLAALDNKENYDPVAHLYTPVRNPNRINVANPSRQVLKDVTKKFVPSKPGQVNLLTINAGNGAAGSIRMR